MFISWNHSLRLLLLLVACHSRQTIASPPINVDLEAAFSSAPFLIELLETAAEEKPDAYFPILDRIADGHFDSLTTDEQLYDRFLDLLQNDKLITNPQSLSSFNLALSIRNSAPRIEAHYHYYNTSILPLSKVDCDTWIEQGGMQYCDPSLEKADGTLHDDELSNALPFDRSLGPEDAVTTTLYADPMSSKFRTFHKVASQLAKDGKSRYRLRYKPVANAVYKPLVVSGYGVELALKRTDYIVIDDREKEDTKAVESEPAAKTETDLKDEEVADLKPLTQNEVTGLSMKAAEFVARSEHPMDTLLKLTQDFPKHSNTIAQHNSSTAFRDEHFQNREAFLPSGFNVLWINGAQYDPRKVDAFSLLDHLRRERRLLGYFQETGLTSAETLKLMASPSIMETFSKSQGARYDWRDENEGGNIIMWLNDLEKDKRYRDWSSDLTTLLQRLFPGQMPTLRRDMFNTIMPIDFSNPSNVQQVTETILGLIKRKIAIRWGIVPLTRTVDAQNQAKILYHLQETYGLVAVMDYLEKIADSKLKSMAPLEGVFKTVLEKRTPREGKPTLSFAEILQDEDIQARIEGSQSYLNRLGAFQESAPIFVNGVAMKQEEDWITGLSHQVSADLRIIQRGIYEGTYEDDIWLPSVFLNDSSLRRNPFIVPEDEKAVALFNLHGLFDDDDLKTLPQIEANTDVSPVESAQLVLIADFDTEYGLSLALNVTKFRETKDSIQVVFVHNPSKSVDSTKATNFLNLLQSTKNDLEKLAIGITSLISGSYDGSSTESWPEPKQIYPLRLKAGENAILFNGRKLGPIPSEQSLTVNDFELLLDYENKKRLDPARKALFDLKLDSKVKNSNHAAILFSLLAVASVSEVPEGIFEVPPQVRTDMFYEWKEDHTTITVGDNSTAVIQLVASIDPASEIAQRWTPILKVLSELDGVYLRIYLNPKDRLEELPIKRFYRYVLDSKPAFTQDGSIQGGSAQFKGIPEQALLTLAMDVPAAWVVTSKVSIHDLDNIKLSSLPANGKVDATYELEYILIEGHSREAPSASPPAGVQLVLSTPENSKIADTIVMANLGYFQFKANPGHYNINLKSGRSQEIYDLQSVGAYGYEAQPGDESHEVSLISFQGLTLYPRLLRKPGKEEEEVLEPAPSKTPDLVKQGQKLVDNLLHKAGMKKSDQALETRKHADINIFSVASGHLYERMLNIMMVSVMRHTNHTVKFWFIEQFLSPSFKAFLPTMAETYGFQFEMVTYKWPHWLRAQKEKQREIWGYKILFLDVLFPLDLDKVIFVDADQIVRTDMQELNDVDLNGAPYGFTPMCDSRVEMEGFRFWKQGYWKNFLRGLPYHISALYVVDLKRFRQLAAGDRLRQQYHTLSADPGSLSNLDQDLPNNMQMNIPIHSLDQNWLWCETWCSDESLKEAKTIDLCNNPQTKEPKLERARRQVPEWTEYDDEIAEVARRTKQGVDRPMGSVQEDELAGKTESETATEAETETETEKPKPSEKDEL